MDVRCPNDGEMTNKRCWKCGWVRGSEQLPDDQGIVSGVDELVAFVRRCVDRDEQKALMVLDVNVQADLINGKPAPRWEMSPDSSSIYSTDGILRVRHTWKPEAEHIARWDPARVLAEVKAKRERLLWIEGELADDDTQETVQWLAKIEAQPYAGQDGWREEWRA